MIDKSRLRITLSAKRVRVIGEINNKTETEQMDFFRVIHLLLWTPINKHTNSRAAGDKLCILLP